MRVAPAKSTAPIGFTNKHLISLVFFDRMLAQHREHLRDIEKWLYHAQIVCLLTLETVMMLTASEIRKIYALQKSCITAFETEVCRGTHFCADLRLLQIWRFLKWELHPSQIWQHGWITTGRQLHKHSICAWYSHVSISRKCSLCWASIRPVFWATRITLSRSY